jgi:hypothetical protein
MAHSLSLIENIEEGGISVTYVTVLSHDLLLWFHCTVVIGRCCFLPEAVEWAALFFVIEDGDASPLWIKVKNPNAPAVKREAEEDWGR